MEGFFNRKKGGARELLAIEKKILFLGQDNFFLGRRELHGFYVDCLFFLWGMKGAVLTWQFQTGWLRLHFWGRSKLQLSQVLSLGLLSWALAQVMPFWACGFLFNREKKVTGKSTLYYPNYSLRDGLKLGTHGCECLHFSCESLGKCLLSPCLGFPHLWDPGGISHPEELCGSNHVMNM